VFTLGFVLAFVYVFPCANDVEGPPVAEEGSLSDALGYKWILLINRGGTPGKKKIINLTPLPTGPVSIGSRT
jgi:hypothetical protein